MASPKQKAAPDHGAARLHFADGRYCDADEAGISAELEATLAADETASTWLAADDTALEADALADELSAAVDGASLVAEAGASALLAAAGAGNGTGECDSVDR